MFDLQMKNGDFVAMEDVLDSLTVEQKMQCAEYLLYELRERPFDFKRVLVNVFEVPNYYDDGALANALTPIINAR